MLQYPFSHKCVYNTGVFCTSFNASHCHALHWSSVCLVEIIIYGSVCWGKQWSLPKCEVLKIHIHLQQKLESLFSCRNNMPQQMGKPSPKPMKASGNCYSPSLCACVRVPCRNGPILEITFILRRFSLLDMSKYRLGWFETEVSKPRNAVGDQIQFWTLEFNGRLISF